MSVRCDRLFVAIPWLVLCGFFVIFLGEGSVIDVWRPVRHALLGSLPAFAVYCALSWRCFMSGSGPQDRSTWVANALAAMLCFPTASFGIITGLNVYLDRSPATRHSVLVIRKYDNRASTDWSSLPFDFVTESWRADIPELEFHAYSDEEYARVVPGKTRLTVYARAGAFGFDWAVRGALEQP